MNLCNNVIVNLNENKSERTVEQRRAKIIYLEVVNFVIIVVITIAYIYAIRTSIGLSGWMRMSI